MVPPIISTRFFEIDIPRPVPGNRLTVEVRSRSNGSNIFFINSGLMPIPLSFTQNSYTAIPHTVLFSCVPGSCRNLTEILPPTGVNLMAFDRRLRRIWFSLVLSQQTVSFAISPASTESFSCFAWTCPLVIVSSSRSTSGSFTSDSSR